MFCDRCRSETTDGSKFCPYCGNSLSGEGASSAPQQNPRIQQMHQKYASVFADKSEQLVSILGNSFAAAFFSTGMLGNGFAILSDKRVYFKGKCIYRNGKWLRFLQEERTVDNKDITGTGFIHNKCVWALVLFWITLIMTLSFYLTMISESEGSAISAGFGTILTLLFWYIYKAQTRSLFEISFAGGKIAFDLRWISLGEAQTFQKEIRRMKDQAQQNQSGGSGNHPSQDIIKQLQEVTGLYRQGAISEQQFEQLKNKLING